MLGWQLIIVQIFTFIFIILFLKWLLHSQINRALVKLRQLNKENMEKAEVLRKETGKAKQEIDREIAEGRKEALRIKEQAREDAESKRKEIIYKSREEAKRIVEEGKRDLERNRKDFMIDMQNKIAAIAVDMIKCLLSEGGKRSFHVQFIDELIEEMRKLSAEELRAEGDIAEIVSTYPLSTEQREEIREILSSKLDKSINLEEKLDESLVAGLIVKLGGFSVIDGSVQSKMKKLFPMVKEEIKRFYNS